MKQLSSDIYGLSQQLGASLKQRQWVVTTAESCTGGGIAQAITAAPGSSRWFTQGFITYSNDSKQQLLDVSEQLLDAHGAVSEAVVRAMVAGALVQSSADVAVAVSGIAGPDGGTADKPTGTVWIAWQQRYITARCQHFLFSGNREDIRDQAVTEALKGLCKITDINTV